MELLGPTTATYTFALPKIFSPQVIVRDGRGCFGSRTTNSGHLESVSGITQERRSYCAGGSSSCCHHHANSHSYRANQANSRSCHHANSHSCHASQANSHADSGCRHVNSLSRYVNSLSCHTNSLSYHTKSRPCRANSPSCHANSLSGYADSLSGYADSQSCHANSRSCHASSLSDYVNSCPSPDLLDLTKSSCCRLREKGVKNEHDESSDRGGCQWYPERQQENSNVCDHPNDCSGYKHTGSSCAWGKVKKPGTLQCPQDTADSEDFPLVKDMGHERSGFPLWDDRKEELRRLQQTSCRESGRQFDVPTSTGSPESGGDKVTCAGTWVPPGGPPPPPAAPPPPPPAPPMPSLSATPHPASSHLGGPPPLLFCPPNRSSLETQSCPTSEKVYEVTASRVSPSVQQRGASRSTDDACATSTSTAGHSTTTDNVTNSDSFCELCSLDRTRTVQSSGGDFSGTLGQDSNPNYDSVMRQPVPEALSGESHTNVVSEHPDSPHAAYVPEQLQTQCRGASACWEVTGVADHDLTQTGHKGETYDEMSSRDCHKLDTEYRQEVSPAVFCTRGSAGVDGVSQHTGVKRLHHHPTGREFFSGGPLTGTELPSENPHTGREFLLGGLHAGKEFPSGGSHTPSRHAPQAPYTLWNDKHCPDYASSIVEYRGIWTVIKASNTVSYPGVHVFGAEDKLPADLHSTDPDHARSGLDVRWDGRVGEPCEAMERRSREPRLNSRNGIEARLFRFGEELFVGESTYSPYSFLSTSCSSCVCSCSQQEPYDLSTKTATSTTKTNFAVTNVYENKSSHSLSTNRQMCSSAFGTGAVHRSTCDLTINPCYKRHDWADSGFDVSPKAQDKKTRNVSSVVTDTSNGGKRPPGHHVYWMPSFPRSDSPQPQTPDPQQLPGATRERSACGDIQNLIQCPPLPQLSNASQMWSYDSYQRDPNTHYSQLKNTRPSTFPQKINTTEANECDIVPQAVVTFSSNAAPEVPNLCNSSVAIRPATLHSDSEADTTTVTGECLQPATVENHAPNPVASRTIYEPDLQPATSTERSTTPTPLSTSASASAGASAAPETADQGSGCSSKPVILSSTMAAKKESGQSVATQEQQQHGRPVRKRRPRLRTFQCALCSVACSNRGQLQGHLRTHTGERPFTCPDPGCNKAFVRNEELTRHRRIHSGERPYACDMCGKAFTRKDHLNKHVRMHLEPATKGGEQMELA